MEKRKPIKTWVSDTFPLEKLECQYFDICRDYRPSDKIKGKRDRVCKYDYPCELRNWLREVLEPYVANNNVKFQIGLILDERKKKSD